MLNEIFQPKKRFLCVIFTQFLKRIMYGENLTAKILSFLTIEYPSFYFNICVAKLAVHHTPFPGPNPEKFCYNVITRAVETKDSVLMERTIEYLDSRESHG